MEIVVQSTSFISDSKNRECLSRTPNIALESTSRAQNVHVPGHTETMAFTKASKLFYGTRKGLWVGIKLLYQRCMHGSWRWRGIVVSVVCFSRGLDCEVVEG
jgi:hypothetical protein